MGGDGESDISVGAGEGVGRMVNVRLAPFTIPPTRSLAPTVMSLTPSLPMLIASP